MSVVRPVAELEDIERVLGLFDAVWSAPARERVPHGLLRAMTAHSCLLLAAYDDERIVGAALGWWGRDDDDAFLFSSRLGVLPSHRGTGVAEALKRRQAAEAAELGVGEVRWTFDPMRARNAAFNLRKLGATATRYYEHLYGPREDAMNAGEETDRLLVRWRAGEPAAPPHGDDTLRVVIPPDHAEYQRLPVEGRRQLRADVRARLQQAFAAGYVAIGFERPGAYVLARATA